MAKTYNVTDNEKEQFVEEIEIKEEKRTHQKKWLLEQRAWIDNLLSHFKDDNLLS